MKKILLILAAILLTTVGFAQNKVSGVVMDDNSEPLAGVAVLVKGTQKGGVKPRRESRPMQTDDSQSMSAKATSSPSPTSA